MGFLDLIFGLFEVASNKAQEMQKEERERIIQQTELTYNLKKEWFKSLLRVKV